MFARLIDDFKDRTGAALRLTSLVAMAAFTLFTAIAFLCAAGFVWMLRTYGPIEACLAGACVFLVIAVIMMGIYILRKSQLEARAAATRRRAPMSIRRSTISRSAAALRSMPRKTPPVRSKRPWKT